MHEVRDTLRACGETEPYRGSVRSSVLISIEAGANDDAGAECEPISLDFLAPPSHPEMLGRIGRYEVERMIGSGGMGIVLKGFDTELHRVVAIKVLKPHLATNGAARRRFAREAQSAAAVVHEHVIPIHDVQSEGDMPFLVMQYVPGQSLQARVDERGPLEPREVLRIARQAAAGLAAAHAQGLVHRDVKPANILMEQSVERVLISDFGLARTVDDATLTRTGIVAGTPHYMSPEQAGGRAVDHRSDLFSLGSVIYFMCTGRPPFRAEHAMAILNRICHDTHRPVDEVNSDVPAELAEIVDRLLEKDPDNRFKNANEVVGQLESILINLHNGKRSQQRRWRRGWMRWRSTVQQTLRHIVIVTACMTTGMFLAWWRWNSMPSNQKTVVVSDSSANGTDDSDKALRPSVDKISDSQQRISQLPIRVEQDGFARELSEALLSIDEMESRWNRDPQLTAAGPSVDIEWRRSLDRINAELELLEQAPSLPDFQSQPVPPFPFERKRTMDSNEGLSSLPPA